MVAMSCRSGRSEPQIDSHALLSGRDVILSSILVFCFLAFVGVAVNFNLRSERDPLVVPSTGRAVVENSDLKKGSSSALGQRRTGGREELIKFLAFIDIVGRNAKRT